MSHYENKRVLCQSGVQVALDGHQTNTMAAITYAYEAFYCGCATPTQLYYVDLADKALAEIDRIRDLTDAVNRTKLRNLAVKLARSYMADGDDEDLDEAIVNSYHTDNGDTCVALFKLVEKLVTPPS